MKRTMFTRVLSLFLMVVMLISVFPAEVGAVRSQVTDNTSYRHVTCTSLSEQALAYYQGVNQYKFLSLLPGVDNAADSYAAMQNNPLYDALYTLMDETQEFLPKYITTDEGTLADYWHYTDAIGGEHGYQYFYADISSNEYGIEEMQREHIWPQSLASYGTINGGTDLHHLRPSIGKVNNAKSDRAFANLHSKGAYNNYCDVNGKRVLWYNDDQLDVCDYVKGDIARILLYVYCRWRQPNLYSDVPTSLLPPGDEPGDKNYGLACIENRDTLLEWCRLDPVDEWEMTRNDRCEDVEGNRNVFIDYPEYAWLMFGLEVPEDMPTPGKSTAPADPSSYKVTAVSNNDSYGTVSVSGSLVYLYPDNAYEPVSFDVISGQADVALYHSTLVVRAQSDCKIRVNFAPKHVYTLHFACPTGAYVDDIYAYYGDVVTLPEPSGMPLEGGYKYKFIGWSDEPVGQSPVETPYHKVGSTVTIREDRTLYPLYYYVTGPSGEVQYLILKSVDQLHEGVRIVVAATDVDVAIGYEKAAHNRLQAPVTKSADKKSLVPSEDTALLRLSRGEVEGTYLLTDERSGENLYSASSSYSYLHSGEETGARACWLFTANSNGTTEVVSQGEYTRNIIRYNDKSKVFSCYPKSNSKSITVYVETIDGELYYTTVPGEACAHSSAAKVAAKAATCTTAGNSLHWICNSCGQYFTDAACTRPTTQAEVTIPALGHVTSYVNNGDGTHSTVCSRCGASLEGSKAHSYTDGLCVCGAAAPKDDFSGRYYIAAIRSSGNYQYLRGELTTTSTKRYVAEDSGLTTLPASIAQPDPMKVFVITKQKGGTYAISCEGITGAEKYLGWVSGNTGYLSANPEPLKLTEGANGTVEIALERDATRILALPTNSSYQYFAWYAGTQIKAMTLIPVTGTTHVHSYTARKTAATCTKEGYTTYTCSCGDSYVGNKVAALGHDEEFMDNGNGTHSSICNRCGTILSDDVVHTFTGGVCICGASEATGSYNGSYYIAAVRSTGTYRYMVGTLTATSTTRYPAADSGLTKLPGSISNPTVTQVFQINQLKNGNYTIACSNGKYLGWTSGASGTLVDRAEEVTIANGGKAGTVRISLAREASRILALNATASNEYFAWYAGTGIKDLVLIPVTAAHVHSYTAKKTPPTCTEEGYTTYTCSCSNSYVADKVAPLGHTDAYTDNGNGTHKHTCTVCKAVIAASEPHVYNQGKCACGAVTTAASNYEGRYYIAAIRSTGNYQYMTGTLVGTSTKRYGLEDSKVTTLPEKITAPDGNKVFTITKNKNGTYFISCDGITAPEKYLSWTSGTTGAFSASGQEIQISESTGGTVKISLAKDPSRILALNATTSNAYFAWYAGTQVKNLVLIPVQTAAHTHKYTSVVTAPTCTAKGYTTYTCSCGDSYTGNSVAALGHVENCKDSGDGTHKVVCAICGKTIKAAQAHTYRNGICTACGSVEPAVQDSYTGRYYIAAVRSSGNYEYLTGTLSGSSTKRYVSADSGLTKLPASITAADANRVFVVEKQADGSYTFRCEGDGTYLSWTSGNSGALSTTPEGIQIKEGSKAGTVNLSLSRDPSRVLALNSAPSNHYFAWYAGTQVKDLILVPVATKTYRSAFVGRSHTAPELYFSYASLYLDSDISVNYYVAEDTLDGWDNAYAVFEKSVYDTDGNVVKVEQTMVDDFSIKTLNDEEYFVFTFEGINSVEMGSDITATLYGIQGETILAGTPLHYSVKQYAANKLATTDDEKMKTLLVDLLNYGSAAQKYFNYNTENLVGDSLLPEEQVWGTEEIPQLTSCREIVPCDQEMVTFKSCSLLTKNKVSLCCYLDLDRYEGSVEELYALITVGDEEYLVDGTDFVFRQDTTGENGYAVIWDGLDATQMSTPVMVQIINEGAEYISPSLIYSIESYAKTYSDGAYGTLSDLVNAMMRYGNSCNAYFE